MPRESSKKKLKYIKPKFTVKKINIKFFQQLMGDYFDCVDPFAECGKKGDLYALRSHSYSSDMRLKRNIKPLEDVMVKIRKLRGITFEWKKPTGVSKLREIGVVAQEVNEVFPEIVRKPKGNAYMVVDYAKIAPILIEAVKELGRENEKLKKRIEALERK